MAGLVTVAAVAEGAVALAGVVDEGALELLLGASEVLGTAEACGDAVPGVCSSQPAIKNNATAAQAAPSGRILMMPPVELRLTRGE
ncbi:hypothetical protein P3102_32125 [Amycolatopsis sp. QT-25]|uniref:hypothetical protein n=1 Tax=Amycolatopsis sp. QT-25 TaxID=3034022 RepID=UPI0023ECC60D|nr:hypothetical protein [Amycolatopsis sp. QT-25]WET78649.1 hypothetical protein P3102_32125 [Amycolatopsis sp. QT-25]